MHQRIGIKSVVFNLIYSNKILSEFIWKSTQLPHLLCKFSIVFTLNFHFKFNLNFTNSFHFKFFFFLNFWILLNSFLLFTFGFFEISLNFSSFLLLPNYYGKYNLIKLFHFLRLETFQLAWLKEIIGMFYYFFITIVKNSS